MAWGRFGPVRLNDEAPTDDWIGARDDEVARRRALEDAGYGAWVGSTASGENLQAARPSDVVALGADALSADGAEGVRQDNYPAGSGEAADSQSQSAATDARTTSAAPSVRYVKARPGDSISSLVGTSDPGAIGRFAALNGMDGRSSNIYAGRVYALPAEGQKPSSDDAILGGHLLQRDDARAAALRGGANATNDEFTARLERGQNIWTGAPVGGGGGVASPKQPPSRSWYDGPLLKVPAAAGAFAAGALFGGIVRGPVRTGQLIGNTLDFGARLLDPNDAENHPLDQPARERVKEGVKDFGPDAAALAGWVLSNPGGAARFVADEFHKARDAHGPTSIPVAPTLAAEARDQFEIGANDGEILLVPTAAAGRLRAAMRGGEEAVAAARL